MIKKTIFDKGFLLFILTMTFLLMPLSSLASNQNGLWVNSDWLAQSLSANNLLVIDVRTNDEYNQGHIKNAINIPVKNTFNPKTHTDRVASIKHIKALFSEAGIDYKRNIVLYDNGSHIDAGRVFWVFEVYGHNNVKLLNGGFPAWKKNPINLVSKDLTIPTKSNYIPKLNPKRLSTKLAVQLAINR